MMNLDTVVKLTVVFELKKDQYIDRSTSETDLTESKELSERVCQERIS